MADIVVTFRLWGLIPCGFSRKFALSRRTVIILLAIDQKSGAWAKNPFWVSKNTGWHIQKSLFVFPECDIKRAYPSSIHFSLEKAKSLSPHGLPSDTPRVLVFAANPVSPSVDKINVSGGGNLASHPI